MSREMQITIVSPFYRALSRLLDFPESAMKESLAEIDEAIRNAPMLGAASRQAGLNFTAWIQSQDLLDLQELYTQTFDLTVEHTLYILHHLMEEQDRAKGEAMAGLIAFYRENGIEYVASELPDYLPAILECAAILSTDDAHDFLKQSEEAVIILHDRLQRNTSSYLPVFEMLCDHLSQLKSPKIATKHEECMP
jgi:nitrate reductase delta subunit